jgi:Domain of unknown function (DUF1707)
MSTPPDPPGLRISDADRERAARRLQVALAEGRITVSELDERLTVVYAARYEAELRPPLADLPDPDAAPAPVRLDRAGPPTVLRAGISGIRRSGRWTVPARLRVQSVMGSVLLDFSQAEIPHSVVEVELEMAASSAKLLLPDHATADVDGLATPLGEVKSRVPARPREGGVHFVVHGRCSIGSVVLRHRYRFAGHRF